MPTSLAVGRTANRGMSLWTLSEPRFLKFAEPDLAAGHFYVPPQNTLQEKGTRNLD